MEGVRKDGLVEAAVVEVVAEATEDADVDAAEGAAAAGADFGLEHEHPLVHLAAIHGGGIELEINLFSVALGCLAGERVGKVFEAKGLRLIDGELAVGTVG